ncbi:MAG: hypothetical protein WB661_00980 [Candidatus Bathyarchaeia archaeon]
MTLKPYRAYDSHGRPLRDEHDEQLRELRAEKLSPESLIIAHNHPEHQLRHNKPRNPQAWTPTTER